MENLVKCSRVLYDKDIIDKNEEINSLKKKFRYYEEPKIDFANMEEYKIKKNEAYKIIREGIDKWIIEDTFEYEHMSYRGLTPRQNVNITIYIEKALNLITKEQNKEWAYRISNEIIYGINGFLNTLIDTEIWELIYSQLNSKIMSDIIYNNIVWQLDDGDTSNSSGILGDIRLFTCKICKKKDDYINEDNICFDCHEEK
jgi:hypothetical protein